MTSIYKPDIKIIDLLKSSKFTLSAEVIPPRNGSSQSTVFEQINNLVSRGTEFLSVTKGAGGSLRGGSLPIAQAIKDHFQKPCIAHFTCRDLNNEEVENLLIDHHLFGIRNILALRGDPPVGQIEWQAKDGSHNYAYQLIEQIKKLNEGQYLERKGFKNKPSEKTDFCIGCAVYPDAPTYKERIEHYKAKYDAGAEYAISQMLFSAESYYEFLNESTKAGINIPILPGVRILKSKQQAERLSQRFNFKVDKSLFQQLPEEESSQQALEVFLKLKEQFITTGAPGIHIFVLSDTDLVCEALKQLT